MFSQRFAAKHWLTILIGAIVFVSNTTDPGALAQAQQSTQDRNQLESPSERRIRAQLEQKRSFVVGESVTKNTTSRLENRLRKELREQRSTQQVLPTSTQSTPLVIEATGSVTRQAGFNQPVEPIDYFRSNSALPPNSVAQADPVFVEFERQAVGPDGSSLAAFEQLAIENHPTLNAAVARILATRHEALQAGLLPNPQLGLFIDEMGNDNDPGLWGAYFQRNVVRGNKLALGRKVKNRQASVLEIQFESQALRIKTDVRLAFYKLLVAQEKYQLAMQLFDSQQNAVSKSSQLFEAGETPRTDLLQTELQAQKAMVLLARSESQQQNAWRELATVVGAPELAPRRITGSFETTEKIVSFEYCLEQILTNSPELQAAKAEVERVRSTVEHQLAQSIPDYQTQITLGRDSTSNHFFTGVQLQVPLQLCDRNQGNIAAAKSRLVAAQNDVEAIALRLSKRLASEYQLYHAAVVKSDLFATKLLPNSQQTLDLLATGYPVEVSFLRLVTAQQTVIDITMEYLDTLDELWASRLKIEGLLLDNSLGQ